MTAKSPPQDIGSSQTSNQEPLVSERKLLINKLRTLNTSMVVDLRSGLYEIKTSSCALILGTEKNISGQILNCFINS